MSACRAHVRRRRTSSARALRSSCLQSTYPCRSLNDPGVRRHGSASAAVLLPSERHDVGHGWCGQESSQRVRDQCHGAGSNGTCMTTAAGLRRQAQRQTSQANERSCGIQCCWPPRPTDGVGARAVARGVTSPRASPHSPARAWRHAAPAASFPRPSRIRTPVRSCRGRCHRVGFRLDGRAGDRVLRDGQCVMGHGQRAGRLSPWPTKRPQAHQPSPRPHRRASGGSAWTPACRPCGLG